MGEEAKGKEGGIELNSRRTSKMKINEVYWFSVNLCTLLLKSCLKNGIYNLTSGLTQLQLLAK